MNTQDVNGKNRNVVMVENNAIPYSRQHSAIPYVKSRNAVDSDVLKNRNCCNGAVDFNDQATIVKYGKIAGVVILSVVVLNYLGVVKWKKI